MQPKEQRTVDGIETAVDTMIYRAPEIERILRVGFELARARRKHLTSVDKQNILETSRLWRRIVETDGMPIIPTSPSSIYWSITPPCNSCGVPGDST